jgi:O-antigen/teichoic acid export membrane protein
MSRTRRFLGGVGFGYANQALVTVVGLWLTPFLLYRIGQQDYGLWLVGVQILAYLALMDLGVVALLPRATAYATGRAGGSAETKELPEIIGHTVRLVILQTPLVALAAFILWLILPAEWSQLRLPLGLVMISFVITFPLRIFQAVLQGLQDLAFLGKSVICVWMMTTAITVGLVVAGLGLYSLAIGFTANQVLISMICWLRLRHRFPNVLPHGLPPLPWVVARGQLTNGLWASIGQVAQVLICGTDVLIIGKLLGPLAVVPYVCTGKLIGVLYNQPQLLMHTAGPALSELRTGARPHYLFRVCTALSQAMLITSGAVFCVVLAVNQGFVGWWVGTNQYGGFGLTLLLLANMMLRHWNLTIGYTIFCFGYERRLAVVGLLDGLVTVGAALLLAWLLGPMGAPLGSIIGVCLVGLPVNLSALAKESGVSRLRLVQPLWPWLGRFLMMSVAATLLTKIRVPNNFLALAVTSTGVALCYVAVMLPVALQSPLGDYTRPRLTLVKARFSKALGLGSSAA